MVGWSTTNATYILYECEVASHTAINSTLDHMNKKSILCFVLVALFSLLNVAEAADIKVSHNAKGRADTGLFYGQIVAGDTQRFAKFFIKYPAVMLLKIDSRGGDVTEAIRIGELVRALRIQVDVADRGVCASSCFFIWMNGSYRLAVEENYRGGSGPVGLHRPFFVNPENYEGSLQRQSNAMVGIRNYLESNLIPRRLIDIMMSRPSNEIYWLTFMDLEEINPIPPALEELFIAKCQGNIRQLSAQLQQANIKNDSQEKARVEGQLREVFDCTNDLNFDAHVAAIIKLEAGWLPPVPFKAGK